MQSSTQQPQPQQQGQDGAEFTQSRRFLIQLLLHRYQQLLNRLETQFAVSPEQRAQLVKTILTYDWVSSSDAADYAK